MHLITSEANKIKAIFDKSIQGWSWDRDVLRSFIDHDAKVSGSILLIPPKAEYYHKIFKRYAQNESFDLSEQFLDHLQIELSDKALLTKKLTLLKEKITLDNIRDRKPLLDYSHLPEDIRLPFKHQSLELEYAVRFPAFYSLDEMQLGKTRVAIERHLFIKPDFSFVICPTSVMYNWENEIKKWCPKGTTSHIINGSKKQKLEEINLLLGKIDFYIINFEGINAIKEDLLNLITPNTNIIIDEFIKIKNSTRIRTKNTIDICNKTKWVMGMCGTPISQGSVDLFGPSLCIDKGRKYGFNHKSFIDKYYWKEGWKLIPKKHTYNKLSDLLYENSIRFTRKECLDIPAKRYQQIEMDLPPDNQKVYDQMVKFAISELEGQEVTAPIILVQLLRLSQITSGFIKTPENKIVEFKDQPKLDALSDILDNRQPTIIWSRFTRDIKAIAKQCMDKGLSFGCIVGSAFSETKKGNSKIEQLCDLIHPEANNHEAIKTAYLKKVKELHPDWNNGVESDDLKKINALYQSLNKFNNLQLPNMLAGHYAIPQQNIGLDAYNRQRIADKFQAGQIDVIIGTAGSGGIGLTMSRAETMVYYSNDYVLINRLQSEDRTQATTQKNSVMIYDLVARNTIDIGILEILMQKKNIADIITKDNLLNVVRGK